MPRRRMTSSEVEAFEAAHASEPTEPEPEWAPLRFLDDPVRPPSDRWLVGNFGGTIDPPPLGGEARAFVRREDGQLEVWVGRVVGLRRPGVPRLDVREDAVDLVQLELLGSGRRRTFTRPELHAASALPAHRFADRMLVAGRQRRGEPATITRSIRAQNVHRRSPPSARLESRRGDE